MWIKYWYLLNTKKAFDLWVFLCLISAPEFYDLALVDTWRFSKYTWSLDQQVTRKSRQGRFTLTHNPAKINCHWRCETGDAPLWLVVIALAKVEIKLFFAYHVITWLMINESHDSVGEIPSFEMTKVIVRAAELNDKNIYVLEIGTSLCYKLGQLCFITN